MPVNRFNYIPFVTERMVARHPQLNEPDTEGEYADGKYKTEALALEDGYTARFQAEIRAFAEASFPGKKGVPTGSEGFCSDNVVLLPWGEAKAGVISFRFKAPKKKPELVDAKGKALKEGTTIRGGSIIRIAGVIAAWEKGSKRGVSLWPDAVRVIKLSEGFDASRAFGGPEDGYDGSVEV